MKYRAAVIALCLLHLFTDVSGSIRMDESALDPVIVIENGTEEAVVLRCPYLLGEGEHPGLFVRWAYESPDKILYQWIPGSEPTVVDSQNDVIDISHEASSEPNKIHSDLRFLAPTTELNGKYVCKVASHEDEETTAVRLVVYSLPPEINMTLTEEDDNITVTCQSGPTFPLPHLAITLTDKNGENVELIEDSTVSYYDSEYEVEQLAVLPLDIEPGYKLECRLTIPYTELSLTDEIVTEPLEEEVTTIEEPESDTTSTIVNDSGEEDFEIEPASVKSKESTGTGARNLGSWWLLLLVATLTRSILQ